jgi:hypothetical protein
MNGTALLTIAHRRYTAYYLHHAGFLLGLFFDPENEGGMFLRNVGSLATFLISGISHIERSLSPHTQTKQQHN